LKAFDMKSDQWVTRGAADSEEHGGRLAKEWVANDRLKSDAPLTWRKIAK
jgi:hypothetical protein